MAGAVWGWVGAQLLQAALGLYLWASVSLLSWVGAVRASGVLSPGEAPPGL